MSLDDNNILTNKQWSDLWQEINLFEQTGDRTILNQLLVSIMNSIIESLDDGCQHKDDDHMGKQNMITFIESELAQMTAINLCPSWCCHQQKIQPLHQNSHRFSDYLINIARTKAYDKNNNGFVSKEIIRRIFGTQISNEEMAELLQISRITKNGDVDYKDFATLMLIL